MSLENVKEGDRIAIYYGYDPYPDLVTVAKVTKLHVIDVQGAKWRVGCGSRAGETGTRRPSYATVITDEILHQLRCKRLRSQSLAILRVIERDPDVPVEVLDAIVVAGKSLLEKKS
jgi:hypothetical protein